MRLPFVLIAIIAFLPTPLFAQAHLTAEQRTDMKAHLQNLTPQQRATLSDGASTKWQNLTPAQQAAIAAKARTRFDRLTPEQKQAVRERMRQRRTTGQAQ